VLVQRISAVCEAACVSVLPPDLAGEQMGARDAQLLKSYADGRKRIEAIVCRKLLATQGEAVGLSMSDFAR
jgi:hypothetical protein